ncbi:Periplasmic beta-glucosidase precursor [Neofusicoccum parvum]|nr:Periplasmic beta-glucosidase precursor [Neofusicoccum parvum]
MADTVVLPRPTDTTLGGSASLRLAPQEAADIPPSLPQHAAGHDSEFHEESSSLKVNGVGQPDRVARDLAAKLPLKEQVSLLAGSDFWRTVALPHRGIPSIKTTDGPNGARGQWFKNGTPAALFPCGISLAATWNLDLMEEVGKHLGDETKARGADVLLAPTVCLHRSPLGGRNFESFSEDPFLTGKLAAAYIRGLQSKKVAATIKHFAGNEQETLRMTIDSIIAERPLRELYLKPFEIAIREASPWALMSSYNLINGVHADMYEHTMKKILRDEWKYDGLVMSDWTGTNGVAEPIAAGCALEMPGPTKWRGERAIRAVEKGELSAEDVERAAGDVLYLVQRTKGFNDTPEPEERANDNPEIRQVIRQAGAEGLTLLKNERGLLPITSAKKIAVIGPNAKRAIAGGGGSASLNPYYTTTPFEGLANHFDGELLYSQGCDTAKWLPLASPFCTTADGQQGVTLEYYYHDRFEGAPASVQHKATTDLFLWDSAPKAVLPAYSFRVKTTITPKTSGTHTFSFSSVGPGKFFLDGELFIDNWDWIEEGEAMFDASEDVLKSVYLEEGKPVQILVESTNEVRPAWKITPGKPTHVYGGCRIGYEEEPRVNLLQEAVDAAKEADAAVVFVGLDAEWESEGYDRQTMDLPKNGSQDRLVEAVLAANPNTIVVNQSGTPVTMPWADKAPAILQAWYQGQEAGNALADVLLGRQSPGGKLPTTFPKRLSDNPAYHNWPGENAKVVYGEGIFIGYRHYDRCGIEPLFPFGHGLTYTTFEYGEATISDRTLAEDGAVKVNVPVTNTGGFAAAEIVQGYVKDVKSRLPRPEKELQAFGKVFLQPGETKGVELAFDKYSVGYYDTSLEAYIAEEGRFEVFIGSSSADIRCSTSFEVLESFTWVF